MKKFIGFVLVLWPSVILANDNRDSFFTRLSKLEFDSARRNAVLEENSQVKFEMLQLAEVLFYEGQKERSHFKLWRENSTEDLDNELYFIRLLNAGYVNLFYDHTKGDAYKHFYKAYQLGKKLEDPILIKSALLALLKYYNFEIAQNSDSYKPFLEHFERLKSNYEDEVLVTLYKMIFYSKVIGKLDQRYYELSKSLSEYEERIPAKSPLLVLVLFETAIKFETVGDWENASRYFKETIGHAMNYPFLKDERFFSYIKLLNLETQKKNFNLAKVYLTSAKNEINLADTLRSDYYLNLYGSHFYNAQNKNDSAFLLLRKAYVEDFQLDFRRNTLEVNRLNVELETQEKENSNLRLRESRAWLVSALVGLALLFLASYLAYTNQRSKNRIQLKDKEVQALRLEKILSDQEIFGIDAMIEGQEKERQRIADDLHDNLGSILANLKLHFQSIKIEKGIIESNQDRLLQTTDDLLEEAYQKVRGMAHAGNTGVNAQEGLLPTVKKFASKVSIINRLVIEVEEHGMDSRLENSLEITIFRIIQELITNIIKHAHANMAFIHLTHHEDAINLMVEDNGVGFDLTQIKTSRGMGLHSIQKKIENLGGRVTIDSITQKGTTVIIDIPLT